MLSSMDINTIWKLRNFRKKFPVFIDFMNYKHQFLLKRLYFLILFITIWFLKCSICIFCIYFKQCLNPIKREKCAHGRGISKQEKEKLFCTEFSSSSSTSVFSPKFPRANCSDHNPADVGSNV